jgi:hypothetical protein
MAETKNQTAAPKETKAQAFVRLANPRVSKALSAIEIIGNLASPNYEYTEDQAKKIVDALTSEVATLAAKFAKPEAATKKGFSL